MTLRGRAGRELEAIGVAGSAFEMDHLDWEKGERALKRGTRHRGRPEAVVVGRRRCVVHLQDTND